MAKAARQQSHVLASLSTAERVAILVRMADALDAHQEDIMMANALDVELASAGNIDDALMQRLVLKPEKLSQLTAGIRQLANMEEPIGRCISKLEIAEVRTRVRAFVFRN